MLKKCLILMLLIHCSDSYTSEKTAKRTYTKKIKSNIAAPAIAPIDQAVLITALENVEQIRKKPKTSYYKAQRTRNLYDSSSSEPFKLSRSKIQDFLKCERCFFIDRKKGTGHVPGYPFSLNSAVDNLLKKEFDSYRAQQKVHPICAENNVNVVPFQHPMLEEWRNSLYQGVQFQVPGTNIILTGGIDDLWVNLETNELFVVDYKATSKKGNVNLDADWQSDYKQQIEIYQWLLRQQIGTNLDAKHTISNTGYFVYCNGDAQAESFGNTLKFKSSLLAYEGDSSWVQPAVIAAYQCLQSNKIPASSESCDNCQYVKTVNNHCAEELTA